MRKDILKEWLLEWTFKERRDDLSTHIIHRYPAMFLPEMVNKIITTFTDEGDKVLDIFNGSGTTLVESMLLKRRSIGIELNPLACFIAKVKTTIINDLNIEKSIKIVENNFHSIKEIPPIIFDNYKLWFDEITIDSVSSLVSAIYLSECSDDIKDIFTLSLSEIVREISYCNHSGFKMHRDKNKLLNSTYDRSKLWSKLIPVVTRNLKAVKDFSSNDYEYYKPLIINGDSTKYQKEITKESIDLIITSPPYGDSSTTVAYGEFSRLSSQILGLKTISGESITRLDKELLGGKPQKRDFSLIKGKSLTLDNVCELFESRILLEEDSKIKNRIRARLNVIMSFYEDLYISLENGYEYLKFGKFFVLVTGSRVVHNTKLHTDFIISELCRHLNLSLKTIFFREIINKRMPSAVSATNIKGEKSPTMTEESICILQKK